MGGAPTNTALCDICAAVINDTAAAGSTRCGDVACRVRDNRGQALTRTTHTTHGVCIVHAVSQTVTTVAIIGEQTVGLFWGA